MKSLDELLRLAVFDMSRDPGGPPDDPDPEPDPEPDPTPGQNN